MFKAFLILLTIGLGAEFGFAQATFAPGDPSRDSTQKVLQPEAKVTKPKRPKKSFFEVAADIRSHVYEEPGFVKHSGILYGIWGHYLARTDWGSFGVDSIYSYGQGTRYDGTICSLITSVCTPYSTNNQTDLVSKTKAVVYLPFSESIRSKGGIGYRYYSNSVSEPGFYLRTGTYIFVPLALEFHYEMNPSFKWKFELGYDYILSGGIKSNTSEVRSDFNDVYMAQTGNGLNTAIQLRYLNRYIFGLYYETWNLDVSDPADVAPGQPFNEPANQTTAIGLRFGYDFY